MNETTVRTVKRPWNCPQDVPEGLVWISCGNGLPDFMESLLVGIESLGIIVGRHHTNDPISWDALRDSGFKYSVDHRATWNPCTVEIPAPIEFHPIPDWLTRHNPEKLTPEQVGEEWRLLATVELDGRFSRKCDIWRSDLHGWTYTGNAEGKHKDYTYRVPSSTPYPDKPKTQWEKDGDAFTKWNRTLNGYSEICASDEGTLSTLQSVWKAALEYARSK